MNNIEPLHPDIVPDSPEPKQQTQQPVTTQPPVNIPRRIETIEPTYVTERNYSGIALITMGLFFILVGAFVLMSNSDDKSGLAALVAFFISGFGVLLIIAKIFTGSGTKKVLSLYGQSAEALRTEYIRRFKKALLLFAISAVLILLPFGLPFVIAVIPALTIFYGLLMIVGQIAAIVLSLLGIENLVKAIRIKWQHKKVVASKN